MNVSRVSLKFIISLIYVRQQHWIWFVLITADIKLFHTKKKLIIPGLRPAILDNSNNNILYQHLKLVNLMYIFSINYPSCIWLRRFCERVSKRKKNCIILFSFISETFSSKITCEKMSRKKNTNNRHKQQEQKVKQIANNFLFK